MNQTITLLKRMLLASATVGLLLSGCKSPDEGDTTGDATVEADMASDPETEVETTDPATLEGKGIELRMALKFRKGDVFGYSIVTREKVKTTRDTLTADGERVTFDFMHNDQRIQYDYKFKVLEEMESGGARVEATCQRVQFSGSYKTPQNTREMAFDSEAPDAGEKAKTFAQYNAPVDTPYEFIINSEGNILETRNVEPVIKRLLMDDYAGTKLEARNMIREQYSESTLRKIVQHAFQEIEDKPLSVDSSWQLVWTGQIGFMEVRHSAKYTLKGYKDSQAGRVAHVTAVLKSDYLGKKRFDTGQGMATVEEFKIGGRGASTFNIDTGKPLTRKMKQKLLVRFFIEPPEELKQMAPDSPQARDFYMTQDAIIENDVQPLENDVQPLQF